MHAAARNQELSQGSNFFQNVFWMCEQVEERLIHENVNNNIDLEHEQNRCQWFLTVFTLRLTSRLLSFFFILFYF